jgi:hypothetical protein
MGSRRAISRRLTNERPSSPRSVAGFALADHHKKVIGYKVQNRGRNPPVGPQLL